MIFFYDVILKTPHLCTSNVVCLWRVSQMNKFLSSKVCFKKYYPLSVWREQWSVVCESVLSTFSIAWLALCRPLLAVSKKHGKLIGFLRTFMKSRPTKQKLKQRGILKERVFGCDLGEHLLNSGLDGTETDYFLYVL